MQTCLLANPHSALASDAGLAQSIILSARKSVLQLFNASPDHFDVVFTPNATAGVKLVAEAFSQHDQGFEYRYHRDCHTSLVALGNWLGRAITLRPTKRQRVGSTKSATTREALTNGSRFLPIQLSPT
jgi:selenocysteine lyase/cysteine desulfurase